MTQRMVQEKGQDLVEYALVLPLFLLLMLGTFEFGIMIFQYSTVANAAREAARAGIVVSTEDCDDACIQATAEEAARELTAGLHNGDLDVSVDLSPTQVRAEVTYHTNLISRELIGAIGGDGTFDLSSTATMNREQ